MNELIKKYILEKWWYSIIIFFGFVILFLITLYFYIIPSYSLIILGVIFSFISGIIQLINKKWVAGILNLGLSFFTILVSAIVIISILTVFGPSKDTFADNLKLPKNVKLNKPIDTQIGDNFEIIKPNIKRKNINDKIDFQLYNSFQPGLYEYDLWIDSKESGIIFLRAFEITQEIELSTSNLKESFTIRINNTNGTVHKFSTKEDFMINEGEWGKPYGARFEIWFKPDNKNEEMKIFEKNYIIEGWMQ